MKTKLIFAAIGAVIGGALAGLSVYIWEEKEIRALTEALETEMLKADESKKKMKTTETSLQGFLYSVNKHASAEMMEDITTTANNWIKGELSADEMDEIKNVLGVHSPSRHYFEQTQLQWDVDSEEEATVEELIGPPPPGVLDENHPYVIDEREYLGNPDDYKQAVLMYYAGDDTLLDEDDDVIQPDACIGANNLFAFTDTDDPAIFIRNDRLRMMYEVIWDEDTYQEKVLGMRKPLRNQRIYRDKSFEEDGK